MPVDQPVDAPADVPVGQEPVLREPAHRVSHRAILMWTLIGYGRAFIRWLVSIISALILLLGYLWMLWDKEKQCWHDKAANDVVVPVQYYPVN